MQYITFNRGGWGGGKCVLSYFREKSGVKMENSIGRNETAVQEGEYR
jgi:hypothetical protein